MISFRISRQEGVVDDNAYSQVNHGYARSGPPSANEVDRAARQEAVPTYAVVDKSKKKKNQKEEKPPEYATVDKSKKKKKKDEKEDYTYAEVDMSKKSIKKVCLSEIPQYMSLKDFVSILQ